MQVVDPARSPHGQQKILESSGDTARALLNILEDFTSEKDRLSSLQKAVVNILEDFTTEKSRLESTQKAVLNILDDSVAERGRLQSMQKAILNILEDFELEKNKAEITNVHLRKEVSERAAAEEALSQNSIALSRSNAELEQFAYVASHDLQEPLRMVSAYVQLLAEKYHANLGPEAAKYIQYAVDGSQRMHSLIGGLLEFSRVGRDENLDLVKIKTAVEQAVGNLQSTIQETKASVVIDVVHDVFADEIQLSQVFQNLIANAIKFASPGITPAIRISSRVQESKIQVTVADNGIGIDPEHRERIFMIFQRLHDRTKYPGTGLGLAICKKVVQRFGGDIWVESNQNNGSKFMFTLPKGNV